MLICAILSPTIQTQFKAKQSQFQDGILFDDYPFILYTGVLNKKKPNMEKHMKYRWVEGTQQIRWGRYTRPGVIRRRCGSGLKSGYVQEGDFGPEGERDGEEIKKSKIKMEKSKLWKRCGMPF